MTAPKKNHKEKPIRRKEEKPEEPELPKYRDRAKERREDQNPDYEATELGFHAVAPLGTADLRSSDAQKLSIEKSKYLGGDVEHTHLVKGLDYALLNKVRSEIGKKPDVGDDNDGKSSVSKEDQQVSIRTATAKSVYQWMVKPQTIIKTNEMFLPGRMTFIFNMMQGSPHSRHEFRVGQRVHASGDSRRIGSVKYVGPVEGYSGTWVGVDWDNGEGKHDGSVNGVQYFHAKSERSGSFVRVQNLSQGISLLEALESRYRSDSTKDEEDDMYVLSTSNKRVSIQLLGKDKIQDKLSRFEELTSASLSCMGVNSPGDPGPLSTTLPNIKELDLTGNLLSEWKDVGTICEQLPALMVLSLSNNLMSPYKSDLPLLKSIRVLVLNNAGIDWEQVELLRQSLLAIEELHLMGNKINRILPMSSSMVQGFDSLRLLNLEDNCIAEWDEVMKLSQLRCLEQLYLNKNCLNSIFYSNNGWQYESQVTCYKPFQNLRCLLVGDNNISDLASVDSLNLFPNLVEIRISENPITDSRRGGVPRFVLIARLAKVQILNGSEVTPRERKESEIRYVRLVVSKLHANPDEIKRHPRFSQLKKFHGIEDERPSTGAAGPQTMGSGFLSITLKCVGASMGEKPPLTKKLPATTTVGKLKFLCASFFKLQSMKLKLFLQEEGSPLPLPIDNDTSSLMDLGIGNDSIILVDEES